MAEYYSKFVQDFASLCVKMRSLLRTGCEIVFDHACEDEFCNLKEKLYAVPKLSCFDPKKKSFLITDASMKGLGAVLLQKSH